MSKALVRAAAVGCSVLLAAGFVSYRAGGFDWLRPTPPPDEAMPVPVADAIPVATPDEPAPDKTLTPPAILYSSKSGAIITPPAPSAGSTAPAQPAPIMGGSKTITPLIPPSPPPATPSPNPAK